MDAKKKKVLLIDDERDFSAVARKRVESWGYEFIWAHNGPSGIKLINELRPDLVILDLIMPEMDGITVLKNIRKTDKSIPVIMLTSYEDLDMIKRAEKLGITAFSFKLTFETNLRSLIAGALK